MIRIYNRLTLTQQWISATLLAILPLVAAVIFAGGLLVEQAQSQRAMVAKVEWLSNVDVTVRAQLTDIRRSARQYLLLRNEKFLELFGQNVEKLREFQVQLGRSEVSGIDARPLVDLVLEVDSNLREMPLEPGADEMATESVLAALQTSNVLVQELSESVEREIQAILEAEDTKLENAIQQLGFIGILAVPGTILLVVLSSVAVARPMWRLANAIRRLGHESWDEPIVIDGPADLESLGDNLEWMRRRLVASERQKKAFLRHITHELKTPLAAIMEAGALLSDEVPGPVTPDQRHVLKILQNNADSLQMLIQQLLNYNAVAHGLLNTEAEVDLARLCEKVRGKLVSNRPSSRCEWHFTGTPDVVSSDPQAMEMILSNLMSNAHDFAPENGRVEVSWGADNDGWWLKVLDNGPGLSEDDCKNAFKPFYQGKARRRGPLKGTGLGLSIVQECVSHLEGQIDVVSTLSGSEFCLRFPRRVERNL